jgi:uncharacterized repeat protein (TIGR03803 family)
MRASCTLALLCAGAALTSSAQTFRSLVSFDGANGNAPAFVTLVEGLDGNFYGTTEGGGTYCGGTAFKVTPGGTLTTLYSFCSISGCPDGQDPTAGLVQGTDGNLYGTTFAGGLPLDCDSACGTVFKITLEGTLTTLHTFDGSDGANPESPLFQATAGNFYGTTPQYGANGDDTIFEITPTSTLTTLHTFDGTGGGSPYGGLVQSANGNIYSTTYYGGSYERGTVFSLSLGLSPFVESLPSSGIVGANVRILGYNLTGATSVTFNGMPATFTGVSGQYIKTSVPVGATTGAIQVITPTATLSSNVPFTVN